MATLNVTEEQLKLIQTALDFYSRVGMGQFTVIKEHPTFEKHLMNEFKDEDGNIDFHRYHEVREDVDTHLTQGRNLLYNEFNIGRNGSWGIHNEKVDDSCRDAYDLVQVIRHEFWKNNPNRSAMTVDSSVFLTNPQNQNIKVEL